MADHYHAISADRTAGTAPDAAQRARYSHSQTGLSHQQPYARRTFKVAAHHPSQPTPTTRDREIRISGVSNRVLGSLACIVSPFDALASDHPDKETSVGTTPDAGFLLGQ